jgi:F-type H+-transporting ATPase subunit epsilon
MAFYCVIVTPEQQVLEAQVRHVALPAHDGEIGVLTDRAPLLVKLGLGALRIDLADGTRQSFFIEGGVAQMKDNRLTILTHEAVPVEQVDAATAQAAVAEGAGRIPSDDAEAEQKLKRIQRGRVLTAMAKR